jgi:hypothetical protein
VAEQLLHLVQPDCTVASWHEVRRVVAGKQSFDNARATSFYRYQLPAFQQLYGVDLDRVTDDEAGRLDREIFDNYRDQRWLYHVVTERANIELMFNDPYWDRLGFKRNYPWEASTSGAGASGLPLNEAGTYFGPGPK